MYILIFQNEAPTVLTDVVESDPIMQQDVFGPILPILTVQDADEAVTFINSRERPLCVYAYSSNNKVNTSPTKFKNDICHS